MHIMTDVAGLYYHFCICLFIFKLLECSPVPASFFPQQLNLLQSQTLFYVN